MRYIYTHTHTPLGVGGEWCGGAEREKTDHQLHLESDRVREFKEKRYNIRTG